MQVELIIVLLLVVIEFVRDIIYLVKRVYKYIKHKYDKNNIMTNVIFIIVLISTVVLTTKVLTTKDLFTILPSFLVLLFIYIQTQSSKESAKEQLISMNYQIQVAKDSMNLQTKSTKDAMRHQVQHLNKTREQDQLISSINYLIEKTEKSKKELFPLPETIVDITINKDELFSWKQNFSEKTLHAIYKDEIRTVTYPWDNVISYLEILLENKYIPKKHINNNISILCNTLSNNISLIVTLTQKVYILNPKLIYLISPQLFLISKDVDNLYKSKFLSKNTYDLFYILISIPNEKMDMNKQLQEQFISELNRLNLLNEKIDITKIKSIKQSVYEKDKKKNVKFQIEINNILYFRNNGHWSRWSST